MEDPSPSSSTTLSTISNDQNVPALPSASTPPLPSPPSSPLLGPITDSIPPSPSSLSSSFPSGASSYMFSLSGVASHDNSPPHIHYDLSLVIPSLTLPPPLPPLYAEQDNWRNQETVRDKERAAAPTTIYGETLGRLDLLVFGRKGAGKTALANTLVDANNEDIVINDGWDRDRRILSAATVAARRGPHQASNVTITEVDGFDEEDSMAAEVLQPLLADIQRRFEKVNEGLSDNKTSPEVMDMLSGSGSPLHTALIYLLSSPPTPLELTVLTLLSTLIPVITLPPYPPSISTRTSFSSIFQPGQSNKPSILLGPSPLSHQPSISNSNNSSNPSPTGTGTSKAAFRPRNIVELRTGLFRNPAALRGLRVAAAERFAKWREMRTSLSASSLTLGALSISANSSSLMNPNASIAESEEDERIDGGPWMEKEDVERGHLGGGDDDDGEMGHPDPLHLPTLLRLSSALLGVVGRRLVGVVFGTDEGYQDEFRAKSRTRARRRQGEEDYDPWAVWGLAGIAFAIGFCAGLVVNVKESTGV